MSWKDGEILLRKLAGGVDFDGYKSGDGKSPALELSVQNIDRPMHQVWNVAGSIEGREQNEKGLLLVLLETLVVMARWVVIPALLRYWKW